MHKINTFNWCLIIFYFFIWLSIDTYPENLLDFYNFYDNKKLFLSFRFLSPYLFFIIFLIFFKFIKFHTNHKAVNSVILIIFLNYLIQTISLGIFNFSINNLNYISLTFFSFLILINSYNINLENKLFITSLYILSIVTVFYGSILLYWIFFKSTSLNLYGSFPHSLLIARDFSNDVPRSSGISRSALILAIPTMIALIIKKKKSIYFYFFYYFLTLLVLLTQSRIVTLFLFLFIPLIFYWILINKEEHLILKKIFLIIVMPILIWIISMMSKEYLQKIIEKEPNSISYKDKTYEKIIRTVDPKTITSGRFRDWNNIVKSNNNKIIGNGVMGDRYLINQTASNLYLYNYASGGIISVLFFSLIIFRAVFISYKLLLFEKYPNRKNILSISSCLIILFLICRSLVENSFAVFGIDFLIFFTSYFYLEKNYFKSLGLLKNKFKIFKE